MIVERWMPIRGYEGIYELSNTSSIRSCDRVVKFSDNRERFYKGKPKVPYQGKHRLKIVLWKNNHPKTFNVKSLVETHFN